MENADDIYIELQKHLDKQTIGFPATKSGVEIIILKELFNPEQASLVLNLTDKSQSAIDVFNKVKGRGLSLEKVTSLLEEMDDNATIGSAENKGKKYYFTMSLTGILNYFEGFTSHQSKAALDEYFAGEFGKAFKSTLVSRWRTIPVEKSIKVEHHIATYDQIREIINNMEGPIGVGQCICREGAKRRGHSCNVTSRLETCMGFSELAKRAIKGGRLREVTHEEALEIIRQNEVDGLVLQPANYPKIEGVCSCCGCCCGVLSGLKMLPKPAENWAHSFCSSVDIEKCNGCGICAEKCQMGAIAIDEQDGNATNDLDRCIGCGNCVASCPVEAIRLVRKEI